MGKKSLQLQQLNNKMWRFATLKQVATPPTGWIKAIRTTIGMSMQQLGNKLNISKQAILDKEKREKDGFIIIGRVLPKEGDLAQKFNRITAVEPCTNVS
jgi:DNA-binding XRE family transcriptional regulator